jgi:signal peptidase I
MKNTLQDREALVVSRLFYEPKQGDIVVFHQTHDKIDAYNKPIVKRVIALEGQTVKIDFANGEVYVDGELFNEEYVYLDTGSYEPLYWADYGDMNYITSVFETVVPEGEIFVMGDNRNHSIDSRKNDIGTVDERRILGRVIFKLSPFGAVE